MSTTCRNLSPRGTTPPGHRTHPSGWWSTAISSARSVGMVYPEIKDIRQRLGDRLRFVYRHFPRPEHPHARHAAEAAEAAAAQGEQHFWAMHDALFEHQQALEDAQLVLYASDIGLDTGRFSQDLGQHMYRHRIREDLESGAHSGVHGTPRCLSTACPTRDYHQRQSCIEFCFQSLATSSRGDVDEGLTRVGDVTAKRQRDLAVARVVRCVQHEFAQWSEVASGAIQVTCRCRHQFHIERHGPRADPRREPAKCTSAWTS